MKEKDWLRCVDPLAAIQYVEDHSTNRKARLFACAIGRALLPFVGDDCFSTLVEIAEQFADGNVNALRLHEARVGDFRARLGSASRIVETVGDRGCWQTARLMITGLYGINEIERRDWGRRVYKKARACVLDIFGNPFRPVTLDPRWLTSSVLDLANGIYEERAFERMPILADALMDAGCASDDIIQHCRSDGPHVRGCWVVDLLLGKS